MPFPPNQQCQSTEGNRSFTHTHTHTHTRTHTHTHTRIFHPPHTYQFNGPFSRTTRVSRYQKGKTNLDFTEARDSEWLWHELGHMQVCTSLQTDNQASTPPLSFLQAGCPSCRPTNSVKAMKAFFHPPVATYSARVRVRVIYKSFIFTFNHWPVKTE